MSIRSPLYSSLYQVNTRVWLTELSTSLGRYATLDDIPGAALDEFAECGFHWIYFLTVWQTGTIGRDISRSNAQWLREFSSEMPDLKLDDICGSGFAVQQYKLDARLRPPEALSRLRERIHARGMRLMLDFVPNHTALDHPWITEHPEYYVQANADLISHFPQNYIRLPSGPSEKIFAHGRDPYFDGRPDTAQLNYGNPETQQAMLAELQRIATVCDGVRCDMAMLLLPRVFAQTWSIDAQAFWPRAISEVRHRTPQFTLMAEVYWDLEGELQQQGFDYTYDKRLYDRLRDGGASPVRQHFCADLSYQQKSARFLENHDEPRTAATFPLDQHRAAAVLTFLCPGLRFFHQGQLEGLTKKLSVHLSRRPSEGTNTEVHAFYISLLSCLELPVLQNGEWRLLECLAAWENNWTADSFIAFGWRDDSNSMVLVVVNYSPQQSQCYLAIPYSEVAGKVLRLQDQLSAVFYDRDGEDLLQHGLYLDLPAWAYHVFLIDMS